MDALAQRGIHCGSCVGTCCTFVANSMQVDEEEARDVARAMDPDTWRVAVQEAVVRFSLDRPPVGDGRRELSRRHYTCPFFRGEALGCAVPRTAKPRGCLAFNPRIAGQTAGGACGVEPGAGGAPETQRRPLPVAVLAAWDKLAQVSD